MNAITLWPEWCRAFSHLGKTTENRPKPPPRSLQHTETGPGPWIAMHAGKYIGGRPNNDGALGTVIQVAGYAGWKATVEEVSDPPGHAGRWGSAGRSGGTIRLRKAGWKDCLINPSLVATSAIVGVFRITGVTPPGESTNPWKFAGSYGIEVEFMALEVPIFNVSGKQGWWTLDADTERTLRARRLLTVQR